MQALQRIAPEMKKLQEKYKDDKQRLNQEMMKFYQEHKVNPFASCLPLLAAAAGLHLALLHAASGPARATSARSSTRRRPEAVPCECDPARRSFLFIPDITDKATGGVLVVLIVLYVGSQLRVEPADVGDGGQEPALLIFLALPFVFVPFIIELPGRPARLLDHDEPLDDRPAVRRPADRRAAGQPSRRPRRRDDDAGQAGGGLRKAPGDAPPRPQRGQPAAAVGAGEQRSAPQRRAAAAAVEAQEEEASGRRR